MQKTTTLALVCALSACHSDPRVAELDEEEPLVAPPLEHDTDITIDVLLSPTSIDVYVTDPAEDCACDARFPSTGACVEYTDLPGCFCYTDGPIVTAPCVTAVDLIDKSGATLRSYGEDDALWTHVDFDVRSFDAPAYDMRTGGLSVVVRGCGLDKTVPLPDTVRESPRVLGTVVETWHYVPETRFYLDEHRPQLVHFNEGLGGRICRMSPSDVVHVTPYVFAVPFHQGRSARVLDLLGPYEAGNGTGRVWAYGTVVDRAIALTAVDDGNDAIPGGTMSLTLVDPLGDATALDLETPAVTRARATGAVTLSADVVDEGSSSPALRAFVVEIAAERDRFALTFDDGTFVAEVHHAPRGEARLDRVERYALSIAEDGLVLRDVDDTTRRRAVRFVLGYDLDAVLVTTLAVDDTPPLAEP